MTGGRVPVVAILHAVAETYGVDVAGLQGAWRAAHMVRARQAAMWLARRAGWSLSDIGRRMGRDHTTVLHGVRQVDALLERGDVAVIDRLEGTWSRALSWVPRGAESRPELDDAVKSPSDGR